MPESDYNYSSDDEPVSKNHNKLLQPVSNLSKIQHIKKVSRKEPSTNANEFDLMKPRVELPKQILSSKSPVSVVDLVRTLKGTRKHVNVGKELRNVVSTGKVLPKPMEKPQADRLMRSINYDKTKKELQRWDAVVAQFQSCETQTFPLDSESVYIKQQKLKEQLKDFETLQKLDPEAALEKLQSLEKNRILERANLRHKNTGTWAKNNLVKAKYNRDVQKDLSEQLALSRQLTEKKDVSEDEDDEKLDSAVNFDFEDKSNPWMQTNGKMALLKRRMLLLLDTGSTGWNKYWLVNCSSELERC